MNLSSRWCVTAVVALGAWGCSDPVPPPGQGAFYANVNSVSPAPANKMCPSGAALTFDVPDETTKMPTEVLSGGTYKHWIVDGIDGQKVSCAVKGGPTFTVEGSIQLGGRSLSVSGGTVAANGAGTAKITLSDSGTPGFSGALSAPSANCMIQAVTTTVSGGMPTLQVKKGSIWASFSCPSVEQAPSDYCKAEGFFVLEQCDQ